MPTLTQTAIVTRKITRYSLYVVVILLVGRVLVGSGIRIYRYFFPKPPPPPTVAFGRLPSLAFGQKKFPENLNFTLETPEGTLPTFPNQAKVYFMPISSQTQLNLEKAKEKASRLGFLTTEQKISEVIYIFPHKESPATLQINIVTGVFSVSYNLGEDPSPLEQNPPAAELAASIARSYLSSAGLLPADLTGPIVPEFLKLGEEKLNTVVSLSEAGLTKINLFRKSFDDFPSKTADPKKGNVWFIVSGAREREKQIIAAEFHYFPVDEEQFATYPLKTAEIAWQELLAGGGFLAALGANEGGNITIRRVYLAYYDSGLATEFYQPIVVFEGDNEFSAYVPAVAFEYYGE